jgi:hypothetical protein
MTQKAAIDLVYESKLRAIDDILEDISNSPVELRRLLIDLFAKNTIKSAISMLWGRYIDLKSAGTPGNTTVLNTKDDDDLLQLTLIFHNYDGSDLKELSISQVFILMFTGTIDGDVKKAKTKNFLPAGFWQLPLLQEALIDILVMNTQLVAASTCATSFVLPEDWEDPKHPKGLFIDVEAQLDLLLPSISAVLVGKEHILKESTLEVLASKGDDAEDASEGDKPKGNKTGKKSDADDKVK